MVVMPEYLTQSKQNPSKPRIISEVKKNCFTKLKLGFTTSLQDFGKSKYSGQLLWNVKNSEWVLRTAEVRQGCLILVDKGTNRIEVRQPLRELNLRPCTPPRTFCLTDAKGVTILIFQALTEDEYEKWVRVLAVELIRQTPLQNVRFLDILSILKPNESEKTPLRRGRSEECITKAQDKFWEPAKTPCNRHTINDPLPETQNSQKCAKPQTDNIVKKIKVRYQSSVPIIEKENEAVKNLWLRAQSMSNLSETNQKQVSDESGFSSGDENTNEIVRNIENFSFLSVKERKNFFESLNSESEAKKGVDNSPLIRSNSISNFKQSHFIPDRFRFHKRKRTKSLHDLHKTPVKEMCQLFEYHQGVKCVEEEEEEGGETKEKNAMAALTQRRLQRGERKLEKLRNQISEVEDTIKAVADDMKSMGKETLKRKEGIEIFAALQRRLDEENSRLERLKEEISRVIKGNQRTLMKLERCNEKGQ